MMDVESRDVWLMKGDCLARMKEIPDESVDMILCDLPYGTTACKWDSVIPFEPLWEQYARIAKKNAAIVLTAAQPFTSRLVMSRMDWFRYDFCWHKNKSTGFLNAKKQPLRAKEDILVFYQNAPTYNPQKTTGHRPVNRYTKRTSDGETVGATKVGVSGGGSTERYPINVLQFPVVNQDGRSAEGNYHPTQKPVALMAYLIKTYTNADDVVLDNAMGSGTTGVACAITGRKFIGIEQDPHYYAVAKERVRGAGGG